MDTTVWISCLRWTDMIYWNSFRQISDHHWSLSGPCHTDHNKYRYSYNSHERGTSQNGTSRNKNSPSENGPRVNGVNVNGPKSSGCWTHIYKCIVPKSVIVEIVHNLGSVPPSFFELFDLIRMLDAHPCWTSGGRWKILRCRTSLSKKKRNNRFLMLRRRRCKWWSQFSSQVTSNCYSGPNITRKTTVCRIRIWTKHSQT